MQRGFMAVAVAVALTLSSAIAPANAQVEPSAAARSDALTRPTAAGAARGPVEHRVALVIGNGNYGDADNSLPNALPDARDVCAALGHLGFETICVEDLPNKRAMRDAVRAYANSLRKGSIGLFYYTGHAVQYRDTNYLLPTRTELRTAADLLDDTFSLAYLMESIAEIPLQLNVVVLDACRDWPAASRLGASLGLGLARVPAPANSVVVFSTSPGTRALDGLGRNSPFTNRFLNHIVEPGITIEEMLKRVIRGVLDDTTKLRAPQRPWYDSSFGGKFCFSGCDDPAVAAELAQVRAAQEQIRQERDQLREEKLSAERARIVVESEKTQLLQKINSLQRELSTKESLLVEASKAKAARASESRSEDELKGDVAKLRQELTQATVAAAESDRLRQVELTKVRDLRAKEVELERRAREIDMLNEKLAAAQNAARQKDQQMRALQEEAVERERRLEELQKRRSFREPTPTSPRSIPPSF